MPIAGVIAEGVLTLILLVILLKFIFGWKPKLSEGRVLLAGLLLIFAELIVLHFLQDTSESHASFSCLSLILPIFFLAPTCDLNTPIWSKVVAVGSAAWMVFLFETGLVFKSYFAVLSVTVLMIPIFQWWRDPRDEGFVKTKLADWKWAAGTLCFFFTATILMVAFGWEKLVVTKYPAKLMWAPFASAALYLLVKAIPEELVFRGIFQGALKDRFGFLPALVGAALLFGAASLNNPQWAWPNWHVAINAFVLGFACGIVYEKTKSFVISGVVNAAVSFSWYMLFARGGF